MKSFRKLIIENFQSHVHTEIDFVPGLNVFVGPSDSGKSAILRALRWVLFNQPRGTDYIREGAKKCRVCLVLDDGTEIERIRGKSENRYILRTPDGKEEIYESIGQGSHPMILQAHQMQPLRWDQKETLLQFASQLDGPFLLSESGGSKAKLIGRISGAHWIDLALKEATRERNQILSEMRHVEKQKDAIDQKLQPYAEVPKWDEAVTKATKRYQAVQQLKQKREQFIRLAEQLLAIRQEQAKQKRWLTRFRNLPQLEQRQWKLEQKVFLLRQLHHFAQKRKRVQREKERAQTILMQTQNLAESEGLYDCLQEKMTKLKQLKMISKKWKQQQAAKRALEKQLSCLQTVPTLMVTYEHCLQQLEQYRLLRQHRRIWAEILHEKKTLHQIVSSTEAAIKWLNEQYPKVEQRLIRYQQLLGIREKYRDNQKSLQVGREYLKSRIQRIEEFSQAYMELLKLSGRCPTCGSPIDALLLDRLEQELCGGEKYAAIGRADESRETKVGES